MKNIFLNFGNLIIFLFVLTSSISAYSIKVGQITIKTNDSDSMVAGFLAQSVHENQIRMEEFFRSRISLPVTIILASSDSQYRQSGGLQIPEWSAAVALRSAAVPESRAGQSRSRPRPAARAHRDPRAAGPSGPFRATAPWNERTLGHR